VAKHLKVRHVVDKANAVWDPEGKYTVFNLLIVMCNSGGSAFSGVS